MPTRRSPSLVLRAAPAPPAVGVLVASGAVAATTALIFALREVVPVVSAGVVYMLAVLLVSIYWGVWLGVGTAIASAAAFNFFHIPPTGEFSIQHGENWVALAVFVIAAGIASTVAELARSRAAEADLRRREADLAAEMARILIGGPDLRQSLAAVGRRLALAYDLSSATLELSVVDGDERRLALPLDAGRGRRGTLVVPASMPTDSLGRLRERTIPALEAVLTAALDREELAAEVVETRALRRSDEIKTAVLRAVSHDLRSPLTAIVAASEAVGSPSLGEAERDELVAVMTAEASRLSHLVDNLLDLSRLEAGTAEPRRDWCSLDEIVRAAAGDADGAAPLRLALDPELPLIRADAAQLERAMANLIENARRYSGDARVSVSGRVVGDRVVVGVVDRGPGIPAGELDRVFEPFYRGAGGGHRGSGLGLAIAKGFVEANGGRIFAESLPGQGATMTIELPVEGQRTARGPAPEASVQA